MFDVAHDHGFSTALYPTKSKFAAFSVNYDDRFGALDLSGEDNGRDKLDFHYNGQSDQIMRKRGWNSRGRSCAGKFVGM